MNFLTLKEVELEDNIGYRFAEKRVQLLDQEEEQSNYSKNHNIEEDQKTLPMLGKEQSSENQHLEALQEEENKEGYLLQDQEALEEDQ